MKAKNQITFGETNLTILNADDTILVTPSGTGANDLSGGDGADVITAANGADKLQGGNGDDQLNGGNGDDILNGGLGTDTLDGGAGIDAVGYDGATSGVTVALRAGAQDTKGAGTDTLMGFENLYGSEFNDKFTGDTFAFMKFTNISLGAADHITDFRRADGDTIELSNIDFSKDPGDQQFTFVGTSTFTARTTPSSCACRTMATATSWSRAISTTTARPISPSR